VLWLQMTNMISYQGLVRTFLSEAEFDSWVRPEQMVGSMKAGR
ncbi:hypothetical protein, partial [Escherichia coli]